MQVGAKILDAAPGLRYPETAILMSSTFQKEIARRAGVSQSTVSRALRNHPWHARAVCQRIQRIAKEMGYVPNVFASALSRQRQSKAGGIKANLAIVCGHPEWNPIRKWTSFADYAKGAAAQAEKLGYTMTEFWRYEPGMTAPRLRRILEARGVLGVLLVMVKDMGELDLDWNRLALTTSGEFHMSPRVHCTTRHLFEDTCRAVDGCQSLGYRRIGLCMGDAYDRYQYNGAVISAFWRKARTFPAADRLPPFTRSLSHARNRSFFLHWMETHRPDVIISMGTWVHDWLKSAGYRVPEDIGYVDLTGDDDVADFTRIDPQRFLLGVAATNLLVGQIQRNERGWPEYVRFVTVPSEWREGKTTRCRREKRKKTGRSVARMRK